MLKGFKDFIMRGNVVDLAVGIVIGAAFTGVVTQLTKSFLEPLIKALGGGTGLSAGRWEITKGNYMDWAGFINALITFLLTAAVLYFFVVFPMNKLAERRQRGEEPPAGGAERGGQAAHRDPGRAGLRRSHHPRPAARGTGRRAGPPDRTPGTALT